MAGYVVFAILYVAGAFQVRMWTALARMYHRPSDPTLPFISRWGWVIGAAGLLMLSGSAGVPVLGTVVGVLVVGALGTWFTLRREGDRDAEADG